MSASDPKRTSASGPFRSNGVNCVCFDAINSVFLQPTNIVGFHSRCRFRTHLLDCQRNPVPRDRPPVVSWTEHLYDAQRHLSRDRKTRARPADNTQQDYRMISGCSAPLFRVARPLRATLQLADFFPLRLPHSKRREEISYGGPADHPCHGRPLRQIDDRLQTQRDKHPGKPEAGHERLAAERL
jgi:hypothetical protein